MEITRRDAIACIGLTILCPNLNLKGKENNVALGIQPLGKYTGCIFESTIEQINWASQLEIRYVDFPSSANITIEYEKGNVQFIAFNPGGPYKTDKVSLQGLKEHIRQYFKEKVLPDIDKFINYINTPQSMEKLYQDSIDVGGTIWKIISLEVTG